MLDYELTRDVSRADVAVENVKATLRALTEFGALMALAVFFQAITWVKEPKDMAIGIVVGFVILFALRWQSTRADLELRKDLRRRIAALEESDGKRD